MKKNIQNNRFDICEKLSEQEGIGKKNILLIPCCIEENPYKYFGIFDSEGEIDDQRIERIRGTRYYNYYCDFKDLHKLDKYNRNYIVENFFNNYDGFTAHEDWFFVDTGIVI